MWNVLLGIGSNLQPRESVVLAVQHLLATFGPFRLSEVAQTDPVGIASPNLFLNAAALLRSPWQGDELKARLNAIEEAMGRDRSHPDRSTRDRTIDLDFLWAGADATPPAELPAANRPYMRPVYQRFCKWLDDPSTAREPLPSTVALAVNGQSFGREPVHLLAPTRFSELNGVLEELTRRVREILGPHCLGVYLNGSFAMGGGDQDSDLDFLVVTRGALSDTQYAALDSMHGDFVGRPGYWANHLEGSYAPRDSLRRWTPDLSPWPYVDNGSPSLERSQHDNTWVVRWTLRRYGIALWGPPVAKFLDPVPTDELLAEIRALMKRWGDELLARPDGMADGWLQPFVVVNFSRMLHSLTVHAITPKAQSVAWALRELDPQWHPLIERAHALRRGQFSRVNTPADLDECARTADFIHYAQHVAGY